MNTMHPYIRTLAAAALISPVLAISACSGTGPTRTDAQFSGPSKRQQAIELFQEASALHERGKLDDALMKYRASIEVDNTYFAAWNNMGQLLMDRRNYADAVSSFRVASDLEPSDPRPEYNIGLAYQTIGWGEESYEHFQLALERDANYLPAIRGVVRSAEMIGLGTPEVLAYIRAGRLKESDDQWRGYFDRQHFRVEKLLNEQD